MQCHAGETEPWEVLDKLYRYFCTFADLEKQWLNPISVVQSLTTHIRTQEDASALHYFNKYSSADRRNAYKDNVGPLREHLPGSDL
jgi:hypothetical protein